MKNKINNMAFHEFHGEFSDLDDVQKAFCTSTDDLKNLDYCFACYDDTNFEGHAFVLFKRQGKWYEVCGYHGSYYGFEDQWQPEYTKLEAILYRLRTGKVCSFDLDLVIFLNKVIKLEGL